MAGYVNDDSSKTSKSGRSEKPVASIRDDRPEPANATQLVNSQAGAFRRCAERLPADEEGADK